MLEYRIFPGTDFTRGPSPHLTWKELDQRDGVRRYPHEWKRKRAATLGFEFELIRERVGGPIRVNSGYRSEEYNKRIGGSRRSQHVQGRAIDLGIPKKLTLEKFRAIILEIAHLPFSRIKGIGEYPTFIHIDVRASERMAHWGGSRLQAELVRTA